ncbi:HGGxSTG domain-containing protein [Microbacterium oleivorans]|uniref:HGGxSTG domain-containing protein n=1 Tax=Microbacterium oleivorans TaxID=273677 RepID=UPI00340CFB4A
MSEAQEGAGGEAVRRADAMQLPPAEYDAQGRRLCGAKTREAGSCRAPAMAGQARCRMHGGSLPQARRAARLRLAELVDPAIGTLAREMVKAERSADRQRAANSILDRAGIARETRVETSDARTMLLERLAALQAERELQAPETVLEVIDAVPVEDEQGDGDV